MGIFGKSDKEILKDVLRTAKKHPPTQYCCPGCRTLTNVATHFVNDSYTCRGCGRHVAVSHGKVIGFR